MGSTLHKLSVNIPAANLAPMVETGKEVTLFFNSGMEAQTFAAKGKALGYRVGTPTLCEAVSVEAALDYCDLVRNEYRNKVGV